MKRFKVTIEEMGEEVRTIGKTWEKGAGDSPEAYSVSKSSSRSRSISPRRA